MLTSLKPTGSPYSVVPLGDGAVERVSEKLIVRCGLRPVIGAATLFVMPGKRRAFYTITFKNQRKNFPDGGVSEMPPALSNSVATPRAPLKPH